MLRGSVAETLAAIEKSTTGGVLSASPPPHIVLWTVGARWSTMAAARLAIPPHLVMATPVFWLKNAQNANPQQTLISSKD
jgi:hypothetical protein